MKYVLIVAPLVESHRWRRRMVSRNLLSATATVSLASSSAFSGSYNA